MITTRTTSKTINYKLQSIKLLDKFLFLQKSFNINNNYISSKSFFTKINKNYSKQKFQKIVNAEFFIFSNKKFHTNNPNNKQKFSTNQIPEDLKNKIKHYLSEIKFSDGKSLIEYEILNDINFNKDKVRIYLNLNKDFRKIKTLIENKINENINNGNLETFPFEVSIAPQEKNTDATNKNSTGLKKVHHIIAVSSCKGGVGKSTVAVNLAFSLSLVRIKINFYIIRIF